MTNLYDSNVVDILPEALKNDFKVHALGYALSQAVKKLLDWSVKTSVFATIDSADEPVVDLLAIELGTQYYDVSFPLSVKRDLVKNTLAWYTSAGTTATLKELINAVFGSGDIIEWWQEEDADPYTYKIRTEAPITGNEVNDFTDTVRKVISVRSHLTAVEITRHTTGESFLGCGQTAYTISKDIKEGGI